VFIAVILKIINYLSRRKLTSVSLPLHTERRSVTIPDVSDDHVLYLESLTLWNLHICSSLKITVKGQQNTTSGGRIGPLNVVFDFFFHFMSLMIYEESECFSSCNFLNPSGDLCITSKFSPGHHLLQHL